MSNNFVVLVGINIKFTKLWIIYSTENLKIVLCEYQFWSVSGHMFLEERELIFCFCKDGMMIKDWEKWVFLRTEAQSEKWAS